MLRTAYKLFLISLLTFSLAVLMASCADQEEITPTAEQEPTSSPETVPTEAVVEEPTTTPEPVQEPTATSEPIILGDPVIEYTVDSQEILAGECTVLRWRTENVEAVYVHPIFDAYDRYPVEAEGSLEVCPEETLPYLFRADLADGTTKGRSITIKVTVVEDEASE